MNKTDTIVLGAGPAGLTGAYELMKLGKSSCILEADQVVGGISRTTTYKGFRFDIGGHRFFSKIDYVNELWHEILSEDFLLRPRLSRIYYNSHFFNYPLKPMNALKGLGLLEAVLICASYARAKLFPRKEEKDFESWMVNRFGYRLFKIFFKTYTEKVWGMPCWSISSDWAAQRINNLSLRQAMLDALFSKKGKDGGEVVASLIEQFHYPRLGPGQMWETCSEALAEKGSPTLLQHRARRLRHTQGRIVEVVADTPCGPKTFASEHLLSSIPLRELVLSLDPPPPAHVVEAAEALQYRDYLTVVLIVNQPDVFKDNWIYIHDPGVKMGRIQNYKNWSPDMVPDQAQTALGLEYFLWESDEEWTWPDEKLVELGTRECVQLGLAKEEDIVDGTVVRMKKAYPIYDDHYQQRLAVIREYLDTFENLQTLGRNGQHRYNNQDHSMMTGVLAARNIAGEQHDPWAVNTDKAYHESSGSGDRMLPEKLRPLAEEALHEILDMVHPSALGGTAAILASAALFIVTAVQLTQGTRELASLLALLSNYLPGYSISLRGLGTGVLWAGALGFTAGYLYARIRNAVTYRAARRIQEKANREAKKDLLDKV